jgi:hypothetical protein
MVDRGRCWVTKFGSIHTDEGKAKVAERNEEEKEFAMRVCKETNYDTWGFPMEVGEFIYCHRDVIRKLLNEYDFIEVKK